MEIVVTFITRRGRELVRLQLAGVHSRRSLVIPRAQWDRGQEPVFARARREWGIGQTSARERFVAGLVAGPTAAASSSSV